MSEHKKIYQCLMLRKFMSRNVFIVNGTAIFFSTDISKFYFQTFKTYVYIFLHRRYSDISVATHKIMEKHFETSVPLVYTRGK